MIRMDLEKMKAFGYYTVPDDDHLSIQDLPVDDPDNFAEVIKHAEALVACSEVIPWPPV